MTPEHRATIDNLISFQSWLGQRLGVPDLGDRLFLAAVKDLTAPVSHSTWNRIKAGGYKSRNGVTVYTNDDA